MSIEQTHRAQTGVLKLQLGRRALRAAILLRVVSLGLALALLGSSALPAKVAYKRQMSLAVAGWEFDLAGWEVDALSRKAVALVNPPVLEFDGAASSKLVQEYLSQARQVGALEWQLREQASAGSVTAEGQEVQEELAQLRSQQAALRPAVEQTIEGQVSWVLAEAGFGVGAYPMPPVQFAFTDPPKKLIVSPRDRIDTIYSRMLDGAIPLNQIEASEAAIDSLYNSRAYITEIGGLGAYPTMVIDQASLPWVLSTVVHEWVHNYLVFFPLGWFYFSSDDLTTLNETVADIAGNELGERVFRLYYPEVAAQAAAAESEAAESEAVPSADPESADAPETFDFEGEMRRTRLEVDRLLAAGEVAAAEAYMEARRQMFVEAGYPLRVLNQAYFAFHGSYGTSAASSSPIGPKLEYLRALVPDVATFLKTVRWFTSVEDLDRAIEEWEAIVRASDPAGVQP